MPRRSSPRARLGLGLATAGCLFVGLYAVALTASGFRLLPPDVAANGLPLALKVHVATAGVALLLLPWQLWPALRRRVRWHRWLGRGYAVAAVAGGVSGTAAAVGTQAGPVAGTGFGVLGVLWTVSTVAAVLAARGGDPVAHRRWAVRSFALAFAAVTLRLELPLAAIAGVGLDVAYPAVAWWCWVPNLVVAEWWWGRRTSQEFATA